MAPPTEAMQLLIWFSIIICYAQTVDRDNPWIALLKVRIRALRGQSMDCPALERSMDCATTHVSGIHAKEER